MFGLRQYAVTFFQDIPDTHIFQEKPIVYSGNFMILKENLFSTEL